MVVAAGDGLGVGRVVGDATADGAGADGVAEDPLGVSPGVGDGAALGAVA